jgi:hypothetical protein
MPMTAIGAAFVSSRAQTIVRSDAASWIEPNETATRAAATHANSRTRRQAATNVSGTAKAIDGPVPQHIHEPHIAGRPQRQPELQRERLSLLEEGRIGRSERRVALVDR